MPLAACDPLSAVDAHQTAYGLFDMAKAKNRPLGAQGKNERAAFAARLPKSQKRQAGRTAAPNVPANIRVFGVNLDAEQRSRIRERLGAKLGKYSTSIERVSVRVKDVNGPRGGVDRACRIKVVLSGLPGVVFENQRASLKAAIDGALDGTERAVRRTVQRRRMKPIRVGTRQSGKNGRGRDDVTTREGTDNGSIETPAGSRRDR